LAELPYKKNTYFFTKREFEFYNTLKPIADKYDLIVFSKARLADLFSVRYDKQWQYSWLNKITSKHIDFILCSDDQCRPEILIELDDSSHDRPERQERDAFVNDVAESGGIPILRIREYTAESLEDEIKAFCSGFENVYDIMPAPAVYTAEEIIADIKKTDFGSMLKNYIFDSLEF